jgi:hypothetical protein
MQPRLSLYEAPPLSAEEFSRLIRSGDPEDLKRLARALSRPDKTMV